MFDRIALALGPALSLLFCANRCRQVWKKLLQASATQKWSFALLCGYLFLFSLGAAMRAYTVLFLHVSQYRLSWGDIVWLLSYVALFGSILLLPRHAWEIFSYVRTILDGMIIMISVIAFSWYFVLGPTIIASHQTMLSKAVLIAFPLFDLLLFYCLVSFQSVDDRLRIVVRFLSLGVVATMLADSLFVHQALGGWYVSGGLLEVGWALGPMLIGLAALVLLRICTNPVINEDIEADDKVLEVPRLWRTLVPYSLVPLVAVLVITIYSQRDGGHDLRTGVYVIGIVLVGAILLRQIFHVRETISYAQTAVRLTNELQVTQEALSEKNLALQQVNQRLEDLMTMDHVTGLANRRALVRVLDLEIARSRRHKHAFSVLFVDIDHFKAINDGYGYVIGNDILRELASVLVKTLRSPDVVGRWDGEEFLAILPETAAGSSLIAARRVCSAIAEHSFSTGEELRLTCSAGVATYPDDATERDHLINVANNAMSIAKKLGRNQFHSARELHALADDKPIGDSSPEQMMSQEKQVPVESTKDETISAS